MQIISNNNYNRTFAFQSQAKTIKNLEYATIIPAMIKSGATVDDIATKLGKSKVTISKWIKIHIDRKISEIRSGVKDYLKKELDDTKASKELNLPLESLPDIRMKFGLTHKASRAMLHKQKKEQIFQAFRDGADINDIMERFGFTKRCAYNYRADYLKEELNVVHDSDEDKIRYIKSRLNAGFKPEQIIKELGGLGKGLCNKILEERAIAERQAQAFYQFNVTNMVIDKLRSGMTLHEIEAESGIPFEDLAKYATAGDAKSAKFVRNIFRQRYIMDRLSEGLSIDEVAKLLNVDRTTAYRYLGKENIRKLKELKHNAILDARKSKTN